MTRIDRCVLFTSGAAAALLVATGIFAQFAPRRGGRLRACARHFTGARRNDQWSSVDGAFMQAARGAVFETLTEISGDGLLYGDIAQTWETEDGGKTWVFAVYPNVIFHDGIALHVDNVIAMFERHSLLGVRRIDVRDAGQILVTLNEINHSFS